MFEDTQETCGYEHDVRTGAIPYWTFVSLTSCDEERGSD